MTALGCLSAAGVAIKRVLSCMDFGAFAKESCVGSANYDYVREDKYQCFFDPSLSMPSSQVEQDCRIFGIRASEAGEMAPLRIRY